MEANQNQIDQWQQDMTDPLYASPGDILEALGNMTAEDALRIAELSKDGAYSNANELMMVVSRVLRTTFNAVVESDLGSKIVAYDGEMTEMQEMEARDRFRQY